MHNECKGNKNEVITKPTWIIHLINETVCEITNPEDVNKEIPDVYINAHTHGINKYGHAELSMVYNCGKKQIMHILNKIGMQIVNHDWIVDIKPGQMIVAGGIIDSSTIILYLPEHNVSGNIYILFPDGNGILPNFLECDEIFRHQIAFVNEIEAGYKKDGFGKDGELIEVD